MAQGLAIAALAAAIGIGLILLQAGLSKLRHRILLPGVIANYRLLPPALVAPPPSCCRWRSLPSAPR
ncbi:hypothetical protein ACFSUK_13225 [Sphingobium scionense]